MNKITIVIVDDHKLVREMWAKMFAVKENIEVVGESGILDEAVELIRLKRPEIVLLDINLPPASGFEAVPLIRKFSPGTKIIAVSMHTEPVYARKMMNLGAKGYVTKNSSHVEMFQAVEEVMKGKLYLCSEIKDILSEQILNNMSSEPTIKSLSMREMEVAKLLKEGLSAKEIAARLNISSRTADVHRQNILKKLNLKNTIALINYLNTNNLLQ